MLEDDTHTTIHAPHSLLVTHLKCEAHLDISHNELVLFNLDGRMEKGEVDARGGMVAGSILMEEAQTHSMYCSAAATSLLITVFFILCASSEFVWLPFSQ